MAWVNWFPLGLTFAVLPLLAWNARNGDPSMAILIGAMAALLTFFTVLILRLEKRGHRSAPELMGRTRTFWWMLALFAISLTMPPWVLFLLLVLLCGLSSYEYFGLFGPDRIAMLLSWILIAAGAALAYVGSVDAFLLLTPLCVVTLLPVIFVLRNKTDGAWRDLSLAAMGILCFAYGLGHSLLLAELGAMPLIYCLFLTEIRDLISYWLGKGFAKTKLSFMHIRVADQVSPNKTWGVGVLSVLVLAGISLAMCPLMPEFARGKMGGIGALGLGALIGGAGLMGDLVFSLMKRDFGVKDSGTILPGKTGVIDRVDSLVLTLPLAFHFIYWLYVSPLH